MKGKRYTKEFKEMIIQEANEVNDVAGGCPAARIRPENNLSMEVGVQA